MYPYSMIGQHVPVGPNPIQIRHAPPPAQAPASAPATAAQLFATLQNAFRLKQPKSVVLTLVRQFNAASLAEARSAGVDLERLNKGGLSRYSLWYGRTGSPLSVMGIFVQAAPGSVEPVAFALEAAALASVSSPGNQVVFGIGLENGAQPIIVYPRR